MSETKTVPNISLEFTPNPNTLKYVLDRDVLQKGPLNFATKESAQRSLLAKRLYDVLGVAGVMIGKNFITITKGAEGDWEGLNRGVMETLKDHLTQNLEIADPGLIPDSSAVPVEGDSIEARICAILENEIRPAVAMDGGDITFVRFEEGVVFLQMQGSCSGCPSSTMTLKQGIERRLKDAIPEVVEVVSV